MSADTVSIARAPSQPCPPRRRRQRHYLWRPEPRPPARRPRRRHGPRRPGEDLLVDNDTAYDSNLVALLAFTAEWGRTDLDHVTCAQQLHVMPGGLHGDVYLNAITVTDDTA